MPNLQDVADDPKALEQSVDNMMRLRGSRGEVVMNHGIRNAKDLEDWVRKPAEPEDLDAYRKLLDSVPAHD